MDGKNPSQSGGSLAGGSLWPATTQAGGSTPPNPISFTPPSLPGTTSTPGTGAFWGPGSTYIPGYTGHPGEIITQGGNAFLQGQGGQWTPAGTGATVPTGAPPPTAPYAGPNSTPGQPLTPYLAPDQLSQLQSQLEQRQMFNGGQLNRQRALGTINSFFGNLAPTVPATPPAGGYIPGYAMPQASAQYVPANAVSGLEQQLFQNPIRKKSQLESILGGWGSGLSSMPAAPGVTVPKIDSSSSGAKK